MSRYSGPLSPKSPASHFPPSSGTGTLRKMRPPSKSGESSFLPFELPRQFKDALDIGGSRRKEKEKRAQEKKQDEIERRYGQHSTGAGVAYRSMQSTQSGATTNMGAEPLHRDHQHHQQQPPYIYQRRASERSQTSLTSNSHSSFAHYTDTRSFSTTRNVTSPTRQLRAAVPPPLIIPGRTERRSIPVDRAHPLHLGLSDSRQIDSRHRHDQGQGHSDGEDTKAITALEQLSAHLLAEVNVAGFHPMPGMAFNPRQSRNRANEGDAHETGYDRTRAVPRQRRDSATANATSLGLEGYVVVPKPSMSTLATFREGDHDHDDGDAHRAKSPTACGPSAGMEGEKESKYGQTQSLRGWRKLRPGSSGGKSRLGDDEATAKGKKERPLSDNGHKRSASLFRPAVPPLPTDIPALPTSRIEAMGGKVGRGLVRMRSVSIRLDIKASASEMVPDMPRASQSSTDHTSSHSHPHAHAHMSMPPPETLTPFISRSSESASMARTISGGTIASSMVIHGAALVQTTSTSSIPARNDPPPVPPRAPTRPPAIRRTSTATCSTKESHKGTLVPLVLHPSVSRESQGDDEPRSKGKISTPMHLGPLPPTPAALALSKDQIDKSHARHESVQGTKSRFGRLRIKRPVISTSDLNINPNASALLDDGPMSPRTRARLIPRDERRFGRQASHSDDEAFSSAESTTPQEPIIGRPAKQRGGSRQAGMTALSFLALDDTDLPPDVRDIPHQILSDTLTLAALLSDETSGYVDDVGEEMLRPYTPANNAMFPRGSFDVYATPRVKRIASAGEPSAPRSSTPLIGHIIPPEERSRICATPMRRGSSASTGSEGEGEGNGVKRVRDSGSRSSESGFDFDSESKRDGGSESNEHHGNISRRRPFTAPLIIPAPALQLPTPLSPPPRPRFARTGSHPSPLDLRPPVSFPSHLGIGSPLGHEAMQRSLSLGAAGAAAGGGVDGNGMASEGVWAYNGWASPTSNVFLSSRVVPPPSETIIDQSTEIKSDSDEKDRKGSVSSVESGVAPIIEVDVDRYSGGRKGSLALSVHEVPNSASSDIAGWRRPSVNSDSERSLYSTRSVASSKAKGKAKCDTPDSTRDSVYSSGSGFNDKISSPGEHIYKSKSTLAGARYAKSEHHVEHEYDDIHAHLRHLSTRPPPPPSSAFGYRKAPPHLDMPATPSPTTSPHVIAHARALPSPLRPHTPHTPHTPSTPFTPSTPSLPFATRSPRSLHSPRSISHSQTSSSRLRTDSLSITGRDSDGRVPSPSPSWSLRFTPGVSPWTPSIKGNVAGEMSEEGRIEKRERVLDEKDRLRGWLAQPVRRRGLGSESAGAGVAASVIIADR